jgi:hypothetical protein
MGLTYSLNAAARMFRMSREKIKQRALDGELPYVVNEKGEFVFTQEALLEHLDELIERNDRIG